MGPGPQARWRGSSRNHTGTCEHPAIPMLPPRMLDLLTDPITTAVATHLGVPREAVSGLYSLPAKGVQADVALPCFQLSKAAAMSPPALAARLAAVVATACPGVSASASGPFLNLVIAPAQVAAQVLPQLADPTQALRGSRGLGRTVCIDFSSPNIAKQLAFHHIRSTMIGNALSRMYAASGWKVVRINFIGDWGTAFGRLIAGWKRENLTLDALTDVDDQVRFFNELYVRISRQGEADPTVAAEARAWSKRLEDGDVEALALWQVIRDASVAAVSRVYDLLGVSFDDWHGEAHYRNAMGPIVDELRAKGLLKLDQGAQVVELTALGMKKPCMILRSDGGSLYSTRDLAACDDRFATYRFDRSLIVVDLGQALHFKEWFAVAKLLGRSYAEGLRHVGFGVVLMWNEEEQAWAKTATRKGVPMILLDVLEEAIARARAIIVEKNPELQGDEREAIAQAVGVGAVVFNDLKHSRTTDVKFTFSEALRFDGETGPYLQFSHARLCSIERKHAEATLGQVIPAAEPRLLTLDAEKGVLLAICRLRPALERAVEQDEPSVLALAVLHLASAIAAWLTAGNHDAQLRVLCSDPALSATRLALASAARGALGEGLRLLGLGAPIRM
jgi:arginyl-tRNA synthetase